MTRRTLTDTQIDNFVETIRSDWSVTHAELADSGHHAVYHLTAETPRGRREAVLKAMPSDGGYGVAVESRIQALLADDTEIPVPAVIGAVDAEAEGGSDLPAPGYLMERVGGESLQRADLGEIGESAVCRIARQLGTHLAELHSLDAVGRFGMLEPAYKSRFAGDRPPANPWTLSVTDGHDDWADTLTAWIDDALDGLDDGRFADLRDRVEPVLRRRAAAASGPFRPVLCHIDASLENHRWNPETGELTAVLDWGFTVAATPAYDLSCVAHSLGGGHWAFLPDTPDYRQTVREPLVEGYRSAFTDSADARIGYDDADERPRVPVERVIEQFESHWECHGLLSVVRTMSLFDWYENRGIGAERREAAAESLREMVQSMM